MNDTVGKVIQQKRRIKGMTQEQLAQLVGVSSAAVSKWETANALPDVTLLCPLARALNCTVDELLDFTPQLTRQEVDAQMEKVRQWFEQGEWNQAVEFCENRLKEYPNDLYLALRVASLYTSYLAVTGSEEAAEQQLQKAIALMERAVEIEEETLRRNALNELAGLYAMNRQFDKALKTLDQLPECNQQAWAIRANVLMLKGELDEAQRLNCASLFSYVQQAQSTLLSLATIAEKRQDIPRALFMLNTVEQLVEMFELSGRAAGMGQMAKIHKAKLYCNQNDWQQAVKEVQAYIQEVLQMIKPISDGRYFNAGLWQQPSPIGTEFQLKNAINLLENVGFPQEVTQTAEYKAAWQALHQAAYGSQKREEETIEREI